MKVLYTGCSYTVGTGWEDLKQSKELWVNIFHKSVFPNHTCINAGKSSASNDEIFERTVKYLSEDDVDVAFVQWSAYPRYRLETGFELYDSNLFISNGLAARTAAEFGLNNITFSNKFVQDFVDKFLLLHHPLYGIVKLVRYTNILLSLANKLGTKIYFINGLCDWDKDFFVRQRNVLPNDYTQYTKELLQIENRDDKEIFALYETMHDRFDNQGTIQEHKWLNLYYGFKKNAIDYNPDGIHPGTQSNINYAEYLKNTLQAI